MTIFNNSSKFNVNGMMTLIQLHNERGRIRLKVKVLCRVGPDNINVV